MTGRIPRDLVIDALDNAAFDEDCLRDEYGYTGGHTCPGVVLPDHNGYTRFIVELARLSEDGGAEHNQTVDWMIDMCRWGTYRSDLIFFWPYLELTDDEGGQ